MIHLNNDINCIIILVKLFNYLIYNLNTINEILIKQNKSLIDSFKLITKK